MKGSVKFYPGRGWVVQYYDPEAKKRIFKTFKHQDDADLFKAHLNVSRSEGNLDARDYAKDNPMGFRAQVEKWLSYHKSEIKDYRHVEAHMNKAIAHFGDKNIKQIDYPELEDFLKTLPANLKPKTKHNIFATLHSFWAWFARREKGRGFTMPDFPEIEFTLGWRNTVDKETQARIIEEVRRISYHINPRVWIGIKWLSTYVAIRPVELLNVKEGDFDLGLGVVNVKHNKEDKPKIVPLLPEDIDLIRSLPTGLPHLYFFRHSRRKGVAAGDRFGEKYFYKWWIQACNNLKIQGVDLYGGTRHSTVRALREYLTPDQIKRGTMHSTNKAFERYFQIEMEDALKVYRTALHTSRINEKTLPGKGKVLKLQV